MAEPPRERVGATERSRVVALAKLAARFGVSCGGSDVHATLEALRARIDGARAAGEVRLADDLAAALETALRA